MNDDSGNNGKQAPEAEAALVGLLLSQPKQIPAVIGAKLFSEDFVSQTARLLYDEVQATYYADDDIDSLVIAQSCSSKLGKLRNCSESEAIKWVGKLSASQRSAAPSKAVSLAKAIKRYASYRRLLRIAYEVEGLVEESEKTPEEIAGRASQLAMQVATEQVLTNELVSFGDLGRNFVRHLREARRLRDLGIELGARFGMRFIDDFTRGIKPTELLVAGGEPGVGKSAVWFKAAQRFAERQRQRPAGERVGTLILSLEMSEEPSSTRLAQSLTGIDGGSMREGDVTDAQIQTITREWARFADLPLWVNHSSVLKASAMKALIVEGIRQHNVGLVVIDHFRYFDLDRRLDRELQEDEEKSRMLKEDLAKDLNVAVICLAHTTKAIDTPDRRPQLRHLRGSGQIGAHADFVAFIHRPSMYDDSLPQTEAEMIWAKNRHQPPGTVPFFFDPGRMVIRDF